MQQPFSNAKLEPAMSSAHSQPLAASEKRRIIAAAIGSALEAFDLSIYALLAVIISQRFFPTATASMSLILTFGTFGVSYVVRPLGAIVIGSFGDRHGRRAALTLALALMGLGSLIIALLPTYETIGALAPIALLCARMMQGFSAGGENASAMTFLAEHHPHQRGRVQSWVISGTGLATAAAAGTTAGIQLVFDASEVANWGWRIPFLIGAVICPVAFYVRSKTEETPDFLNAADVAAERRPLRNVATLHWRAVLMTIAILAVGPVVTYLSLYLPSFASTQLGISAGKSLAGSVVAGFGIFVAAPLAGILVDRFGARTIMSVCALLTFFLIWPAFKLLTSYPSLPGLLGLQLLLGVGTGTYFVAIYGFMADTFAPQTRNTASALSGAITQLLFGGFTPVIFATLVAATHQPTSPAFFVMGAALLSLLGLFLSKRHS
jgi:MHS family proline/betaine transporter-like MFS transporter